MMEKHLEQMRNILIDAGKLLLHKQVLCDDLCLYFTTDFIPLC